MLTLRELPHLHQLASMLPGHSSSSFFFFFFYQVEWFPSGLVDILPFGDLRGKTVNVELSRNIGTPKSVMLFGSLFRVFNQTLHVPLAKGPCFQPPNRDEAER